VTVLAKIVKAAVIESPISIQTFSIFFFKSLSIRKLTLTDRAITFLFVFFDIYYGNAVLGLLHYIALAKLFSNEIKI
jgi:hypothetical protein